MRRYFLLVVVSMVHGAALSSGLDAEGNGRTEQSDIIVGVAMICIPLMCASTYIFILTAIWRDKELLKITSYKLMFVLGCCDVTQCLPHTVTGVMTICQTTWTYWIAKVMGVLATPFYVGYCTLTIILSIQRFTQIASPVTEQIVFSPKATFVWLFAAGCIVLFFVAALSSPWASITYQPQWYSWSYDYDLQYSYIVQKIEMVIEVGSILISLFLYIGVIFLLFRTRARFSSSRSYTTEGKILVQALTVTVYCSILNVLWHNYDTVLPAHLWTYCGLNFMWICNSGVYPIIYIITNRVLQRALSFSIGCVPSRTHRVRPSQRSVTSSTCRMDPSWIISNSNRSCRN